MSKREIKDTILLLIFSVYIAIYEYFVFFQKTFFRKYIEYAEIINISFLVCFLALSIYFLGYRKYKDSFDSKNITKSVLIYTFLSFVIMYGLGLAVGFLKNAYSRNIISMFRNLFIPTLTILLIEWIRYVVLWANKDKKIFIIVFTFLLTLLELGTTIYVLPKNDLEEIFNLFATTIIPIILKNAVMSYLCYHIGYKVPILYRVIMDLYIFVIPIVPDIGDYISSMILIALPSIIYISAFSYIDERKKQVEYFFENDRFTVWDIPIIAAILILAALVSGFFPHVLIGVGSDSMKPAINKGDAVILKKVSNENQLKKHDIIAYYNEEKNKIIIHRIEEISTTNGKTSYVTKGDANNSADMNVVFLKQIKGKVKVKIPYIAYPTVWISEYFSKKR